MFLFLCSIILATAAGITAFLLLSSGNLKDFKRSLIRSNHKKQLPVITEDGTFVDTKEELEAHLEVLQSKLTEKVDLIETSKTKVNDAKESIEKLHSTQAQVKKYYIKLKDEIRKSEDDCKNLQQQIDDYKVRRSELENEMKENEMYYKNLLNVVKSGDAVNISPTTSKSSLGSGSSHELSNRNDESSVARKKLRKSKLPLNDLSEKPSENVSETRPKTAPGDIAKTRLPKHISKCSLPPLNKTCLASPHQPKIKCMKMHICCCGSTKCPGNCNIARCIRLGLVQPKDILSTEIAEYVDVTTAKVLCDKPGSPAHRRPSSAAI